MPVTASLSRSLIQQTVGGKTQIASVISCGLLLIVLMWIGPFFEPLPKVSILIIWQLNKGNILYLLLFYIYSIRRPQPTFKIYVLLSVTSYFISLLMFALFQAILASVIVVALKGMLMQITAFVKFWRLSKMDAAVWMVTFLTAIFIGIDVGLLLGIAMSLCTIFVLGLKPYTCLLGSVPNTDFYLDINRYRGVSII